MPVPDPILVCGGAGFIGSHLVDGFLAQDARVTVIDPCLPETSGSPRHLAEAVPRIRWIERSVEDLSSGDWDDLLSVRPCVIDAMGFTRHREGMANPELDLKLNYRNHLALVPALRRHPVPLIYLGSRGQYGMLRGRVREDSAQVPRDPQGVHKAAAESLFRLEAERGGFPCVSLRLGNCFGPRQPTRGEDVGLVGGFIRDLLRGNAVEVYGNPDRRARQLVYVEDVVACVQRLTLAKPPGFTPVNLAGPNILLRDLLQILTSLVGGSFTFKPFPAEIQALDCGDGELDHERLRRLCPGFDFTDWRPALEKTCAYFKKELA